jgi:lysosome membrane protein 2
MFRCEESTEDFNERMLTESFFSFLFIDAPVVATMPHFLDADNRYGLLIEGLNPTQEKHGIFMDIEPMTGTPLRGGKRMQFNMFLKQIDKIS